MKFSNRLNAIMHPFMTRYVMMSYDRKSRRVERKHPELFAPVDPGLSKRHKSLWGKLGIVSGDRWLRLHVNLTGIQDYRFCPEDIYFACVERIMNDCNQAGYGPEEKNDLMLYLPDGYEPETVLRYIRGSFFTARGEWMPLEKARTLLIGELIGKPCRSSGGSGVELRSDFTPEWIVAHGGESYVVQKKIEQCEFSAQFNPSSINTVRMMTMRCPWNGEIVVCRSMMRMGVSDAVIDNMMKGGLCVCVGNEGQLGRYAYDYDGKRFEQHPVSGATFLGLSHPGYIKMVETAKEIHSRILAFNLLSFDFVQRLDGSICIVEINSTSQGITQLQYDFGGLFGDYTEELVDWCANHIYLDKFSHFRTWY